MQIVGAIQDITAVRQAHRDLERQKQKFEAVFEGAGDAIFLFADDHIFDCNQQALELFGYPSKESLSAADVEMLSSPPTNGNAPSTYSQDLLDKTLAEGIQRFEWKLRRPWGIKRTVEVVLTAFEYDGRKVFQGRAQDITERKEAEDRLRSAEERWKFALQGSGDGVWDWNIPAKRCVYSTRWKEMLGYADHEIGTSENEFLGRVHPQHLSRISAALQAYYDGKAEDYSVEVQVQCKDGDWKWILVRGAAIAQDGQNRPLRMIGTHTDISARKAEEARLAARAEIRGLIASDAPLGLVLDHISAALDADLPGAVTVTVLVHPCGDWVQQISARALPSIFKALSSRPLSRERGPLLTATLDGKPFNSADLISSGDPVLALFAATGFRACEAYPIVSRATKVLGSIWRFARDPQFLSKPGAGDAVAMAGQIAGIAIERKQKDEALFESRQMLQTVLDSVPQRVFWKDRHSTYVGCNTSFARDMGFDDPSEVAGKTDFNATWKADAEAYRSDDRLVIETGRSKLTYEEPQHRPDGRQVWLRTSKVPLCDREGAVIGVLGTYEDISALKKTEESLRLLSSAVEHAKESIVITDAELELPGPRIVYVNSAFTTLSGYSASDVLGKTPRLLQGPRSDRAVLNRLRRNLANGEIFRGETINYRKDGTEYQVEWQIVPIRDNQGAVTHFVGVQRDVTEDRRVRQELLRAKENAEAANQAKSEFLSRMSHELRTPLHAILGFSQLLQRRKLNESQAESVGFIAKAGRHLLELINEILDLSRIECGKMSISPETTDLAELLHEACSLVRSLAEARDVSIQCDVTHRISDRFVLADRQRLKQVFVNLLTNAVKYNRDSGAVHIRCSPGENGQLRIAIRDTGAGITPENLKRLFTPFERLGADQSGIEGTGIGLALSRKLTHLMDGDLEVESVPDQGSTFTVVLPATSPKSADESAEIDIPPDAESSRPVNRTLLYVEDNPVNLHLMKAMVAEFPSTQLVSTSLGGDALSLARLHRPNLILLDLHLPDINGDEVLRQLRADESLRATPIVMLSADAMKQQIHRLKELGADDYMTKPLAMEKFSDLLNLYTLRKP